MFDRNEREEAGEKMWKYQYFVKMNDDTHNKWQKGIETGGMGEETETETENKEIIKERHNEIVYKVF